jgi:hypothetical protein
LQLLLLLLPADTWSLSIKFGPAGCSGLPARRLPAQLLS